MADPIRLTEWITGYDAPYFPELPIRLTGIAHGHPRNPDGQRVVTSVLVRVEGRRAWTESGSEYELVGPPTQAYLDFLAEHGWTFNDAAPFESAPPAPPKSLIRRLWEALWLRERAREALRRG